MGYLDTLRRLGMGAVLALMTAACGNGDENLGPEPPDEGVEPSAGCTDGVLEHGALSRICFPADWNGDLVVYAHGYVAPQHDLSIPDEVVGGRPVSTLVTDLGYAYATTSYRANGLVAPEAVADLLELVDSIEHRYRPDPARAVVVGFSEGGLVATLAVERHPDRFDGAMAGCGPIGDFQAQLNYIADFRVVFDYFFPGLIPGTALDVPESVPERWDEIYVPAIVLALAARPDAARQLLQVTGAPVAGEDLRSMAETTIGLLWYNVFGTADARTRLGGQPLDNTARVYIGSSDDTALNAGVERFTAEPGALAGITRFSTTGNLLVPLVNLHTTGDPIVPFSQAALYAAKVDQAGQSFRFSQIDVERHGHCTFEATELLSAFGALWDQIGRPAASALSGR
ncbi:MAG TPA: prolyl oligopeptidase family serine peptidase [Gemmatimonadales bacterium]|nr:prolyl oligopeptidase family serine peptidase [Gemmatimonadales bacterium]